MGQRISEVFRFCIVGVVATAVHYAVYYLLIGTTGHNVAFTIGYAVSFLMNYVLSSRYTFRVGMSAQRLTGFALSHALNYLLQIILLNVFITVGVAPALAPLPVYAVAIPVNYLLVRFALTRRRRENDGYWLFLIVVGAAMLLLQFLDVPTLSDDMIYRFKWQETDGSAVETIDSLADIFESQVRHYFSVNGRFVVHFLAQLFFVFLPPAVLHVVNALLFVLLIHFCVKITQCRNKLSAAVLISFLLFIVFQGLGTTLLWGLGSFNYLWVSVACLALLLWMRRADRYSTWRHLLLSPLALFVGCGHEALSLPVSAAFFIYIIMYRRELRHKPAVFYMLWFMAGTLFCVLSPGILNRSSEGISLSGRMMSAAMNCISNIRVLWMLTVVLLLMYIKRRDAVKSHLLTYRYAYVALSVAFIIVMLCGTNLERVAFYLDLIAMLLLTVLLRGQTSAVWKKRLTVVFMVLLVLFFVPAYYVRHENKSFWLHAEKQMTEPGRTLISVEQPEEGTSCLMDYFRGHYVNRSFDFGYYCSYMGFDANDINMRCAARLYGKPRMLFLPADVVQRISSDSTAYSHYELDRAGKLYVWRVEDGADVSRVTFLLNPEDRSQLNILQRMVAYDGDSFELDAFRYEVVVVSGRSYLVFTRPTTNIYRRIRYIEVETTN